MEEIGSPRLLFGVRQDFETLLKKFESKQCLRFTSFAGVWRDMKFSHIFYKRFSVAEMMEFTEEMMQIAKCYVVINNSNIVTKIGGFYLLSSLYRKQVLSDIVKIRVTLTEWKQMLKLIDFCQQQKHYDLIYIYHELCMSDAFYFVCTVRPYGLETSYRKYYTTYHANRLKHLPGSCKKSEQTDLIDKSLLQELAEKEKLYLSYKKCLLGDKDMAYVDESFSEKLIKRAVKSESTRNLFQKSDDIGEKRRKLKSKSFAEQKPEEKNESKPSSVTGKPETSGLEKKLIRSAVETTSKTENVCSQALPDL